MKRRRRVKDLLRSGIIMLTGMKGLFLLLAVPLVLCATTAFEAHAATPETALQRILRTGTVRIGYAAEAPYAILALDGRVTGEGPEVARKVFERMGVRNVVAIESEFGMLMHDLKAKRFDVIATGMYILSDRCRQIAFSEPTYRVSTSWGRASPSRPETPGTSTPMAMSHATGRSGWASSPERSSTGSPAKPVSGMSRSCCSPMRRWRRGA